MPQVGERCAQQNKGRVSAADLAVGQAGSLAHGAVVSVELSAGLTAAMELSVDLLAAGSRRASGEGSVSGGCPSQKNVGRLRSVELLAGVELSVDVTADAAVELSVERSVERSVGLSVDRSVERSVELLAGVERSVERSVELSVGLTAAMGLSVDLLAAGSRRASGEGSVSGVCPSQKNVGRLRSVARRSD